VGATSALTGSKLG